MRVHIALMANLKSSRKQRVVRKNHAIRWDSKTQLDHIKAAARKQRRSFNQFVVLSSVEKADKVMAPGGETD
jgi:uncharacterized protein (DUF1778 family)